MLAQKFQSEPVLSDTELLNTARNYQLDPFGLKCRVFALLDNGYSRREVRFLLRNFRDPKRPQVFTETVRRYYQLWLSDQKSKKTK